MGSFWEDVESQPPYRREPLGGPVVADVVVIGAGFSGLATAYYLAQAGVDVVVLESREVGFGASGRNGGQVLPGWSTDMTLLAERFGEAQAWDLWTISEGALERIRSVVDEEKIACRLSTIGHLAVASKDGEALRQLEREWNWLSSHVGYRVQWWDQDTIDGKIGTSAYQGGIFDNQAMAFHPLRYAQGLARAAQQKGVRIFCDTPVTGFSKSQGGGYRLHTRSYPVRSSMLVWATNGYAPRYYPWLRARVMPAFSAQIAVDLSGVQTIPREMPTVSDDAGSFNYFRRFDNFLLFGGRPDHTRAGVKRLQSQLSQVYPQLRERSLTHSWMGRLAISPDYIPHVKEVFPGCWVVAGYTGHGAALSTEMGFLLAQAMTGHVDERFSWLASLSWPPLRLRRVSDRPKALRAHYTMDHLGKF